MATTFNMSDPNPGFWFKFNPDDPESGEISLRPQNAEQRNKTRKKAVKDRVEYKQGQRFEVQDVDDELFSELVWDYSIVDWSGLVDDKGKQIECTTENKVFLMRNHIGFARFVAEKLGELSDGYAERLELENKNLLKGSSASGTRISQTVKHAGK